VPGDDEDALTADEHAGAMLTPILSFLMYEAGQWFAPPDEAAHRETVGGPGANAVGLYRWGQSHPRH
jgi:hypothetical protein